MEEGEVEMALSSSQRDLGFTTHLVDDRIVHRTLKTKNVLTLCTIVPFSSSKGGDKGEVKSFAK